MPVLKSHRFTTRDYHRMADTGVLRPNARVELLDGRIVDMSPIGPFHGGVVNRLSRLFGKLSESDCLVAVQNPVRLNEHSEPQPDLMLLRPAPDDYTTRHACPEDVLLLIEVADTSLDFDREEKLPAYGKAGISEVWIVNLQDQTIQVYREPHMNGFGSKAILRASDPASPQAFPVITVAVSALLKQG